MPLIWYRRLLVVLIGVLIWIAPPPWGLDQEAWQLFALFFSAILAVLLNALPILLAAVFALIAAVLTGTLNIERAFSGFSESFMVLILAAFLVAKAVIKSGLGKRVALFFIGRFGSSTLRLGYCIFATDALLGPAFPSNTARSGILFPIVHALALDTGSKPDKATRRQSGSYLMLCGIASLTISSALWLTAMAANPIGAALAEGFGVQMNFGLWFLVASLPCLLAFSALPYLLYRIFPPERTQTPEAQEAARKELEKMGPLNRNEWITLGVFSGMVIFWGLAGTLQLDLAIIALSGLAIILLTGVYRLKDLRAEGGDALETFIWFSILYVLSTELNDLGFMRTLGSQISMLLAGFSWVSTYLLLTTLYVLLHYLFVSQTAQLLALYAVFLEVGVQAQVPAALMAFMLSFATNYFAAITPQASSANVLFVGSGYLEAKEVYRYGAVITLTNLGIFLLTTPWILWLT